MKIRSFTPGFNGMIRAGTEASKAMKEKTVKHVYCPDVEGLDALGLGLEGSAKMMLRLLSDDSVLIEVEPNGHTPDHTHHDKERLVVISGTGEISVGGNLHPIKPQDFIELDADEQHQVVNSGGEKLVLACFRNQR
jgi:mannose-6-phosphate isomerase-like protein (cupin superfamily)